MEEKLLTEEMLTPHGTVVDILADGKSATCEIGFFGTWSERIKIAFIEDHPEFGDLFSTKDFEFIEPGLIRWGREDKKMKVVLREIKS